MLTLTWQMKYKSLFKVMYRFFIKNEFLLKIHILATIFKTVTVLYVN